MAEKSRHVHPAGAELMHPENIQFFEIIIILKASPICVLYISVNIVGIHNDLIFVYKIWDWNPLKNACLNIYFLIYPK